MMRCVTRLKGIHTIKKKYADGKVRKLYYHRATGIRLPDDATSPEFIAAYRAAEGKEKVKLVSIINDIIDKFKDSKDWKKLRDSTRSVMNINLRSVSAKFGDMPIEALKDRRCRSIFLSWHDELAEEHPRAADAKLGALQRVLVWGYDRALVPSNPIEKFSRAYSSDRVEKIWLPEHVAAFELVATRELSLALCVALHTGQRQGDLIALKWGAFDGVGIKLTQSKRKAKIYIPCTISLLSTLQELKKDAQGEHILIKPNGLPWTSNTFGKAWRATFKKADITDDLHFNDLRGTAVTMLGEAGCTIPEICTITGHSLESATRILEVYLSRTKILAEAAITKLDNHARNKIVNEIVNDEVEGNKKHG